MSTVQSVCVVHCLVERTSPHVVQRDLASFMLLDQFADITFVNAFGSGLLEIKDNKYDLVIISDSFMVFRSSPYWKVLTSRVSDLLRNAKRKALFLQDDYIRPDQTTSFARLNGITVYSVFSHVHDLYASVGVESKPWLIGFADQDLNLMLESMRIPWEARTLDVGQRVLKTPLEYGSEGRRKAVVAERFGKEMSYRGFACDISTEEKDRFTGTDWFHFLANTRSTIGCQSGASLITNSPWMQVRASVIGTVYGEQSFESQLKRLLGQKHQETALLAPSPRIFEAASLGVLQILERSPISYGIEPWDHYVPLERDFSNIEVVSSFLRSREAPETTKRAHEALFSSKEWSRSKWMEDLAKQNGIYRPNIKGRITVPSIELEDYEVLRNGLDQKSRMKFLHIHRLTSSRTKWYPIETVFPWKPMQV